MAAKKASKNTKFQFSWMKLLIGLSLALNLAFIVFLVTMFNTTYFDKALTRMTFERNLDGQGCYIGVSDDDAKICLIGVSVNADDQITAPEWLKGQTLPTPN